MVRSVDRFFWRICLVFVRPVRACTRPSSQPSLDP
jgi:hypothetical protein